MVDDTGYEGGKGEGVREAGGGGKRHEGAAGVVTDGLRSVPENESASTARYEPTEARSTETE